MPSTTPRHLHPDSPARKESSLPALTCAGPLGLAGRGGSPLPWDGRENDGWARESAVFEDLEYDDSDSPAIGLLPAGVPWDDVQDHIKIAHHPLLALPEGGTEYAGVYWAGAAMAVVEELGSDYDEAIREFREFLRERGET